MQQRNIDFLNQHKGIYDFYKISGELRQLDHFTREGLLRVAREEWAANYLCCLTCSGDVIRLIQFCYTQYEKYQKALIQTIPEPVLQKEKKK
jgi:hypothetical protein